MSRFFACRVINVCEVAIHRLQQCKCTETFHMQYWFIGTCEIWCVFISFYYHFSSFNGVVMNTLLCLIAPLRFWLYCCILHMLNVAFLRNKHGKQIHIKSTSTCQDVVDSTANPKQVHNKSNYWSLDFDKLWTCCGIAANHSKLLHHVMIYVIICHTAKMEVINENAKF